MLFFPRRGGPHCLTQKRRAYRTCTAPVARVGLAEPLTPLFSSARTGLPAAGLYQQHDGYPQQGYQQGKGRASPSREARYRSRATRRARARARARGGQGQQGHLHKGQGQGHGQQGQQKSKGAFEGSQRALTHRSHRWATPTRCFASRRNPQCKPESHPSGKSMEQAREAEPVPCGLVHVALLHACPRTESLRGGAAAAVAYSTIGLVDSCGVRELSNISYGLAKCGLVGLDKRRVARCLTRSPRWRSCRCCGSLTRRASPTRRGRSPRPAPALLDAIATAAMPLLYGFNPQELANTWLGRSPKPSTLHRCCSTRSRRLRTETLCGSLREMLI